LAEAKKINLPEQWLPHLNELFVLISIILNIEKADFDSHCTELE